MGLTPIIFVKYFVKVFPLLNPIFLAMSVMLKSVVSKSIKNIDLLAQKCGLTKKYFITIFKQYTLETPHAYINQLRLIEGRAFNK